MGGGSSGHICSYTYAYEGAGSTNIRADQGDFGTPVAETDTYYWWDGDETAGSCAFETATCL